MSNAELLDRYQAVMMNAFGTPQRVFARGDGVWLFDADGRRYLDLLSGLAVNALGHNHPGVNAAITGQLSQLGHVSNFFASEPQIRLAERLAAAAGGDARVFFTNSGTEANEVGMKLARLTGRTKIIAMTGAFHGRTMGSLALTHKAAYREPFEPLPGGVEFVPFGDPEALRAAVTDEVAAVVLETIQGENGVVPAPPGYLALARQLTAEAGALLWIDEVQTGIGRCGELLLHRAEGITADVITIAKGLGNGFPVGACLAQGPAANLITPGSHGNTFAGNPVAAAAANAVLDEVEPMLGQVRELGEWLRAAIAGLNHPLISQVRGRGLLVGVQLTAEVAPQIVAAAMAAGWVINAARPDVLRLAPPLIVTKEQLQGFVTALPELLDANG
ncbi:MAG: acetylornithine aminotransferase [Arachnia propionica]|nr:MAG: acetylornithine aminotransferase [Arachnia propionica]